MNYKMPNNKEKTPVKDHQPLVEIKPLISQEDKNILTEKEREDVIFNDDNYLE